MGQPPERPIARFSLYVAVAVAVLVPGVIIRLVGVPLAPPLAALVYGISIVAAGFLLSWGAEGETHVSKGLIIAALALVTVLPEYSVDIYLAYQAGAQPGSNYVQYAAANMTGANRLLVGAIWPLLALLNAWKSRQSAVPLRWSNVAEVAYLAVASLYAFVIVLRREIGMLDLVVLLGIFGAYLWRASKFPEGEGEEPVGPAAVLQTLRKPVEHTIIIGMTVAAALAILLVTAPFAEALIATGAAWRINEFLLIQWLGPLASEAPVIVVTVLFVTRRNPTTGLASLVSDKINQWTLLVGMLPLVYSIGAGAVLALPLDARQREEFFLTAAQSLYGVSLLMSMKLTWRGALSLLVLFVVQLALAFVFSGNEPRAIQVLTAMAWLYVVLAAIMVARNRAHVLDHIRVGLLNRRPPASAAVAAAGGAPASPVRD